MTRPEKLFLSVVLLVIMVVIYIGDRQNAKWETVALSCSVIVSTAVLVDSALTRRDARESLRLTLADSKAVRDELDRPLVIAYFERRGFMLEMVIENLGNAPASSITFTFPLKPISTSFQDFWSMSMMTNGIAFLSPSQTIRLPFDTLTGAIGNDEEEILVYRGTSSYRHALDPARTFSTDVILDIEYIKGTHYSTKEDPARFAANQLEKISTSLIKLASRR